MKSNDRREGNTGIIGLAKVSVQFSADTFMANQSLVYRINNCGESRHLRKAANPVCLESMEFPIH